MSLGERGQIMGAGLTTRRFASVIGAALVLFAACGFVPPVLAAAEDIHPLSLDTPYNQLFGLFPVNGIDNIVHLLLGAWGVAAGRKQRAAVLYARAMTGVFAVLTVGGFLPFDILPLYGNDIWLHGLLTLIAAYFGWVHRNPLIPQNRGFEAP